MTAPTAIRIFLVDDHTFLRLGLAMLLTLDKRLQVVGEAASVDATMELIDSVAPDVTIFNLKQSIDVGLAEIARLKQARSGRILVLTDREDFDVAKAVLNAGASGVIGKQVSDIELLGAIRSVFEGRTSLNIASGQLTGNPAFPMSPSTIRIDSGTAKLSKREEEVLPLAALGHTSAEIAKHLFLSVKTVETYRSRLMQKLSLRTRADLVRYASERGLLHKPADFPPVQTTSMSS
jgi:two-component system, NarL family, response regulator NreC